MSNETPQATRDTIRISQSLDLNGEPKSSEVVHTVESKIGKSTASQTMDFLSSFTLTRTDEPNLYNYTNPKTGSGQLKLEGFGRIITAEINDLILTREIEREIGQRDPFSPKDGRPLNAFIIRSNNPFILIIIGLAAMALGIYTLVKGFGAEAQSFALASWIMGPLIIIAAAILTGRAIHRAFWWTKARATAMRIAGRIPSNLRSL